MFSRERGRGRAGGPIGGLAGPGPGPWIGPDRGSDQLSDHQPASPTICQNELEIAQNRKPKGVPFGLRFCAISNGVFPL